MNEHRFNFVGLPIGWSLVRLEDLCEKVAKRDGSEEACSRFMYIDIHSIDNTSFTILKPKTYKWAEAPSRAQQIVNAGDILFSTVRTYLKNIALVGEQFQNQVASTGFCVIRAKKGISNKYLFYYSLTKAFIEPLNELQRGSSYPAVRNQDVFAQAIPLSPALEQHRIVAKIEELFSDLDKGIESLKTAQQQLKFYRQAVLKWAFEGRLTKEWRKQQEDLPTEPQLLERINAEHEKRVKASKKKANPSPLLTEPNTLPEGWGWTTLAHIKDFSIYGPRFASSEYKPDGIAVLRTTDINDSGKVDWLTSPKLRLSDKDYDKYKLIKRDLLITRTGSIGTISVFNDDKKAIPGAFLIHYRLVDRLACVWYIFHYLKSALAQRHFREKSAGIGRPNLNVPSIEQLMIPLCSLKEQIQIVQEVESRLTACDKIEESIETSLQQAGALRQSILKKAFEGKLVPQDPNDEPASELLERIRAERDANKTSNATRSRAGKTRIKKAQS